MQGKLIIKKGDQKKLESAAYLRNVKLGEFVTVADETHVEVNAKDIQAIWDCAQTILKVDGTELDAIRANEKKKADAKAAAIAKKK